ncbi:MAG TPA: hypothetical protein VIG49_08215, partial [Acetobacteraceae bacterium]
MALARRVFVTTLAGFAASPVLAQTAPPERIRGTIDKTDGHTLQVTSRTGEKLSVAVRPDTRVTVIAPAKITDIAPGSYIGTAAMPQP